MSDVTFMTSNRGGRILIHNDFIFRKAKTIDIRTYWRCSTNTCRATLLTENDILKKISDTEHNHTSHSNKIKRKHFYSELLKDAGRTPAPTLYKVHVAKAQLNDEEAPSYLPSFDTSKKILYKSLKARRSHNPGNLEGIKLDRNGDSPDNTDILLLSNDKNDNILTHCSEPVYSSLEVRRSHDLENLEEIKLDRNGDSPDNKDILPISNGENDKILTHCSEPIYSSLEVRRSHNPGNLEGIKLDRNGDSLYNKDVLLISNDESDRILKMFPVGTKVIDCDFLSEKDYTAELRLKCKSKEEFKLWLRDFENISGDSYRVAKTVPREGKVVLYKAAYRCHHNTYPFSHRVVKAPSKKHTDCAARLNVTIKAFVPGRRNRSRDTLVADYPTIIKIRNNHNHDTDGVKAVEYRGLEENVDPSWQLQLEEDQPKPEAENQNIFEKIESDAGMCGERPVGPCIINAYTVNQEPVWEELESGTGICGEQPDLDDEEPVWEEMESYDSMWDEESDSEDEEWEEMESDVGVCSDQPHSDDKEHKREEMELLMNEMTAIFRAKFEKNPRGFSNALSNMHKSIRTMKTADLLSAMHNFGKTQYETVTYQSLCNNQSIHKENSVLGTNQSLLEMPEESTFKLEHDYSV